MIMTKDITDNAEPVVASDPEAVYMSQRKEHCVHRQLSVEERASCVTLDELKGELLDMVHDFYHSKS